MSYPRNSGGAWFYAIKGKFDALRQRMTELRDIGAKYVRLWYPWSQIEKTEAQFEFGYHEDIVSTIVTSGLKLDITLCPLMAPDWFWAKYPDALPQDERGRSNQPAATRVNSAHISYWHPELRPRYAAFIDQCFRKSLNHWSPFIHFVRMSMGRFNEPNYPNKQHFWCYDQNARQHFRNAMRDRRGDDLQALNAAWGTTLASFDDIEVPKPAQFRDLTAVHRRDFVEWYRGSKDDFVLWVIDELKRRLKPHQSIVVFPAGSADADRPIERFIEDGTVTDAVRHMERNFWLLERCGQEGQLCAQFAGVGINAANPGAFATTLVEHYAAKGYTFPLYGQIPGLTTKRGEPNNPATVGQLLADLRYHGFAWNKDRDLYEGDGRTKNARFEQLREGFAAIEAHYPADEYRNPTVSDFVIQDRAPGEVILTWTTDRPCDTIAIYGTRKGFIRHVTRLGATLTTEHQLVISGLERGRAHHFVAASDDGAGNFTASTEREHTVG